MTNQQVQPVFILPQDTKRTTGRDAQGNNIAAAKAVAQTVRTTLGPKGMDKMIVDSLGDVIITNDGVTILEEMQIEHPAAKMVVEIAKTQDNEVGDGTTTAVILAGELLKHAEGLLEQNIHPTIITKGFRLAQEKCNEFLKEMAEVVTPKDYSLLRDIAMTSMTGKGAEFARAHLSDIVVKACVEILEEKEGKVKINKENIKIEKRVGGAVDKSSLIKGLVIDKERVHPEMPKQVKDAKVVLLDTSLEVKSTEIDAKIQITNPSQIQAFLDQEEKALLDMVDRIVASGCNCVFSQKGIDDAAQHFLAKAGIMAVRRVKKSDLEKLSLATGAKIVSNLKDLTSADLGMCGRIYEDKVGDEEMIFIEECVNPKAVTILVRGGTEHVVEEVKRALDDAIGSSCATLVSQKAVGGAGACEVELIKGLKGFADSLKGKEQLAVNAFARSLEVIPRTLAENAGLDPIDVITKLKAAHDEGIKWGGIDVFVGDVRDSWKMGVIEPLKTKLQAINSASEVSKMILRIDDIIAGSKQESGPQPPQGMQPPMY